ncbi:MAG: diguanylate cyclase [Sulfurimonas sp.]
MKYSMKKIFSSLQLYLYLILFVSLLGTLMVFEHQLSFKKIDNLRYQKDIVLSLTDLDISDKDLALIEFNGKSNMLYQEIDKLKTFYKYDFTDRFILDNEDEYMQDIQKLSKLISVFNKVAQKYYTDLHQNKTASKSKEELQKALLQVTEHIDNMLLKNITYNEEKFNLIKNVVIIIFILILLATIYYRSVLRSLYNDIESLLEVEKSRKSHEFFTQEADAISLRMKRKHVEHKNPEMIDQITGINNYKGLLNSYAHKKDLKGSNFTAVTVLEIDNFSKSNRTFTHDMIQSILRKVAYTISLHELPVDVIARTDFNQFTLVFSRPSKEQAFKDIEAIRESIAELKFNIPGKGSTQITVTGGFIIKPSNTSLEEAIKKAKEILIYAKTMGKNRILQNRDMAQREL